MNYGRFVYYQPNKLDVKDKVGDCQIRALSKALDKTWLEVFDLIMPICREQQVMDIFSCDLEKTKEALAKLGFKYTGVSNKKGTKRPTVDSFAKEHKTGTYIVTVSHHVVAVVDGKYYDTWDSGYKSMYGYYEKVIKVEVDEDVDAAIEAAFDDIDLGDLDYDGHFVGEETELVYVKGA